MIVLRHALRTRRFLAAALVWGALGHLAWALDPARSVSQYTCQTWKRQDGLPVNGINAIVQTQDGYLWLAGRGGVIRFDGFQFEMFALPTAPPLRSTVVLSLAASSRSGVWLALGIGGFGHFDGNDSWTWGHPPDGQWPWSVHAVAEDRSGSLWTVGQSPTASWSTPTAPEIVIPRGADLEVLSFCEDAQGRIWMGTANRGAVLWDGETLRKLDVPELDQRLIFCMTQDRAGRIWLGTQGGLVCLDVEGKPLPVDYGSWEVRALLADSTGSLWVGTIGSGLLRVQDGSFEQLRVIDGLVNDDVIALAEDREGSLWVGTRDGLTQLSNVKFPSVAHPQGLTGYPHAVCASRGGGVWIATDKGPFHYQGWGRPLAPEAGLEQPFIKRIFEARNGDLYVINGSQTVEVLTQEKVVARHHCPTLPVGMAEDAEGVVVSVGGALFRIGPQEFRPYPFTNNHAPPLYWVVNLAPGRDGCLWVASVNGICRIKDHTFQQWTTAQGLSDNNVRWVCEDDDGILWAGLSTGIARLKDGRIANITRADGLPSNRIFSIVPDDHGALWVDSEAGVFQVARAELNALADGLRQHVTCTRYDGEDALRTGDKYGQEESGCKSLDGHIWFPTPRGLLEIDPSNIPINPTPPPVKIQSVRADRQPLRHTQPAVVPPGRGELEFAYTALSYLAPRRVQFRHRLEGYDSDWVEAGDRRLASYTNLKPGRYTFHVIAANADGVWNTVGDTFAVALQPHFYQTSWFATFSGLVLVWLLAGLYVGRVSILKRRELALQNARDLLEVNVRERTAQLAETNATLQHEVQERRDAQAELEERRRALETEIEERRRAEAEVRRIHEELVLASRKAGQAEVASSVLHNVGNVLNSVNVSAGLLADRLRQLRLTGLGKAAELLQRPDADRIRFLTEDPKGRRLPEYLATLAHHLASEQARLLQELADLSHNIDHIKGVVSMQQAYARAPGLVEPVAVAELADSAIKLLADSFQKQAIRLEREFAVTPIVHLDKHRLLQILVNLLQNARQALEESAQPDKILTLRILQPAPHRLQIIVADNGVGIAPDNLSRIFGHGFTTRPGGHGFGLHSAALAAGEMGGRLTAHSPGPGNGATFTLELPIPYAGKEPSLLPGTIATAPESSHVPPQPVPSLSSETG